jgi:DNA replication protein DnaC
MSVKEGLKTAFTDFSGDKGVGKFFILMALGLFVYTAMVSSSAEALGRGITYIVVALGIYAGLVRS